VTDLPSLGAIGQVGSYRVGDSVTGIAYERRGRHVFVGQRRNRGSRDALILIGKMIERGAVQNYYDSNVWLDVEHPHVIFISGKRGSGKSYDLGVIAEGLALSRPSAVSTKPVSFTSVFFDTQNQFWTLGLELDENIDEDREQLAALARWRLSPERVPNVVLLRPRGTAPLHLGEQEFSITSSDLSVDDWCGLFELDRFTPMGHLLRTLHSLVTIDGWTDADTGSSVDATPDFVPADLLRCLVTAVEVRAVHEAVRDGLQWRLESIAATQLFSAHGLSAADVLRSGQTTVVLLREIEDATKAVVVSVLCRRMFSLMGAHHTRRRAARRFGTTFEDDELPDGAWVLVDEAHVVAPTSRMTAARPTLVEFVKRGRDSGLSLVLATQQPSALDPAILSQVDINISHRLVFDADVSAAVARFPSRLPRNVRSGEQDISAPDDLIRSLGDGTAVLGDSESPRGLLVAVRPRVTPHGGREPSLLDAGTA